MVSGEKTDLFHTNFFPVKNRLALTAGEPKGIGRFVAQESLKRLGAQEKIQFLIWTDSKTPPLNIPGFQTKVFKKAKEALKSPFEESLLLEIKSKKRAGDWLKEAARLCLNKTCSALITGPVSKNMMKKTNPKALSQTSLLQVLSKKKLVVMGFRGHLFNVLLFTDHIPLQKIFIEQKKLKNFLIQSLRWRKFLPLSQTKKTFGDFGIKSPCRGKGAAWRGGKGNFITRLKKILQKRIGRPSHSRWSFFEKILGSL